MAEATTRQSAGRGEAGRAPPPTERSTAALGGPGYAGANGVGRGALATHERVPAGCGTSAARALPAALVAATLALPAALWAPLPEGTGTTGAGAWAQETLCGTYSIRRGDTLSALAQRVYGDRAAFVRFYDDPRNGQSLGNNPNRISVGRTLYLPPCDEEGGSEPLAALDPQASGDPFNLPIELVTGTDFAPFTSEDLPDGGMITRVVREAFSLSDLENEVRIDFINDWGSHLETLLPQVKYTYAFPWYRPDCDDPARLSPTMRVRCDLVWSEPLFSVVIGFYAPATLQDPPQDFAQMQGKRLCRPTGYFTFDLEENGLVPGETIELLQPTSVVDCFEALERGRVDFVTINRFTAEKAIAEAGLTDLVAPIETLVSTQDLHLVAHRRNGDAVRFMAAFNEGLKRLKESGRFSRISSVYFRLHDEEIAKLAEES